MYASCVIEYPVKTLDKTFTYFVPKNLQEKIKVGMKVLVPFGTKLVHGIVLSLENNYQDTYELKEIAKLEDEFLVLNSELLSLGAYLKNETLCNLITAYQTMLPSALKVKEQERQDYNKYESYVLLNQDERIILEFIETHCGKKVQILNQLLDEKEAKRSEFDSSSVHELEKLGFVRIEKRKINRIQKNHINVEEKNLNEEQQHAFDIIKNSFSTYQTFLLHGVTGSGKTLIYIHLIEEVIRFGKTALLLVPEISLTEQVIHIFYDYFGSEVAILHSGLSKAEKYDEYLKILNGEVHIVIGTRSAVFAPLENIGIIIIDEEHSETYKQDSTPRYHALDMAIFRAKYHGCPLVLGSATPSLETMARAKKGVYQYIPLQCRANGRDMPDCKLIDMTGEMAKRNFVISEELDTKIRDTLNRKEQVLLLLNRRGFSTIITCSNCGFTYKCPHCEITLTYHKTSNTLRCHYCGYTKLKDDICPECKEKSLNYMGMGTEKLEDLIQKKYKDARIARMDADTTSRKGAHDKIIQSFKNHEYDILIGTQMISKGLDFPDCTLVGIINADTTLNIPDFRSSERTFQLLSQAAGRSGRGDKTGEVLIQTFNPDNATLKAITHYDYEGFYQSEMQIRKVLKYPPYYYLVNLNICSKDYNEASMHANKVLEYLKKHVDASTIILGPSTALNFKLKNIYRFHITIKYRFDEKLKNTLKELDELYGTNKNVFLEIDFNPLSL